MRGCWTPTGSCASSASIAWPRPITAISPRDAQALFQAYANGVNAFLARRDSLLPAEFMALRYHPEPWRPADSIVWGRLMALWLSTNFEDEQLRQLMSTRLSPQDMQWIFPAAQRLSQREDLPGMPAMGASNNWVIAGRLTASGKPLLANDPHLGLNLPSTWYLARIEFEGRVLAGATAPGVPVVVIGRNDHVAWGFTTAYADTQDLFVETLLDGGQYATPDGPRPLIRRREVIRVKGEKPVTIEVPVDAPWSADGCRSRPASRLCAGLDGPAAR